MFSESAQKELAQDQSYEVTVYLPLNKTESDGRIDGPTFHVIYEDRNGEQKTTAGKYLKPLNRDGLVVSHEFKIK